MRCQDNRHRVEAHDGSDLLEFIESYRHLPSKPISDPSMILAEGVT
jgi:hypothetical protein